MSIRSLAEKNKAVKPKPEDRVDCTSVLYQSMEPAWNLTNSLMGGTPAMRAGGRNWLPQEALETDPQYDVRLNRSFLYSGFKDTIKRLVSKPFSKAVTTLNDDALSDMIKAMLKNVDKTGKDLTQLSRDMLSAGIQYGLTHVFVDFPSMPEGATKADEASVNAHPVLIQITPPQMLSWCVEHGEGGEQRLTEIRFAETRTEKVGKYGDMEVDFIRVIRTNEWELWRKDPDKDETVEDPWVQVGEATPHTFGRIPLVTYYTNRSGFMTAESPLTDLAWTNLAHYQTHSDYRNGVRFTTHGLLMFSGLSKADMEKTMSLGPAGLFRTTNKDAKGAYVEHSGKGIGTARQYLSDIREEMEMLGMQPLVSRTGDATATGKAIDEARTFTDIQAWIRGLEITLRDIIVLAAEIIKEEIADDFAVNINNEFGISLGDAKNINALVESRKAREITRKTYLEELRRVGVLSEILDIDKELKELDAENALEGLGPDDPDDPLKKKDDGPPDE